MTIPLNRRILIPLILLGILFFFCYFRVKPILNQTVPYTYDQGRDFAKTAEIVINKKMTFLGPTTGIEGVFHGAWWYYVLTIPFLIFNGNPIGFYIFIFFVQLVSLFILFYVLYKYFGLLTASLVGLLVSISPYFSANSFFVGNNIMVMPSLLIFLLAHFFLFDKKYLHRLAWIFLIIGLGLGLVSEFEFAFGLLIIPSYLLTILLTPLRAYYVKIKQSIFFAIGLVAIFLPRIFFELRHGFLQTNILINFFLNPKLHNPKSYTDVFKDRVDLFVHYFNQIFVNDIFALIIFLSIIAGIFILIRSKTLIHKNTLYVFATLLGLLFLFSTFYKDTFWGNYYEGIQYLLLLFVIFIPWSKYKQVLLVLALVLGIYNVSTTYANSVVYDGMKVQEDIVQFVTQKQGNNPYCVDIYTPPVIPHTYNYLFSYTSRIKHLPLPQVEWVNQQCWLILEPDNEYPFRRVNWIKMHVPEGAKKLDYKKIKDTEIILYER